MESWGESTEVLLMFSRNAGKNPRPPPPPKKKAKPPEFILKNKPLLPTKSVWTSSAALNPPKGTSQMAVRSLRCQKCRCCRCFWLGGILGMLLRRREKTSSSLGLLNRAAMFHADTFFRNFEMSLYSCW